MKCSLHLHTSKRRESITIILFFFFLYPHQTRSSCPHLVVLPSRRQYTRTNTTSRLCFVCHNQTFQSMDDHGFVKTICLLIAAQLEFFLSVFYVIKDFIFPPRLAHRNPPATPPVLFAVELGSNGEGHHPFVVAADMESRIPEHYSEDENDEDDRDVIVFIHGIQSSSRFWTNIVFPHLGRDLVDRSRLIALDLLGFGKSPRPDSHCSYSMDEQLGAIKHTLFNVLKLRKFHLVGLSLGSIISTAFSARHPDSISSLTLLSLPYFRNERQVRGWLERISGRSISAFWFQHPHLLRTMSGLIAGERRKYFSKFIASLALPSHVPSWVMDDYLSHSFHSLQSTVKQLRRLL